MSLLRRLGGLNAAFLTSTAKSDDRDGKERDAIRDVVRQQLEPDVEDGDQQQHDEREHVSERDAAVQTEHLDEEVVEQHPDERDADVRQTHVEDDRRAGVLRLVVVDGGDERVVWQQEAGPAQHQRQVDGVVVVVGRTGTRPAGPVVVVHAGRG